MFRHHFWIRLLHFVPATLLFSLFLADLHWAVARLVFVILVVLSAIISSTHFLLYAFRLEKFSLEMVTFVYFISFLLPMGIFGALAEIRILLGEERIIPMWLELTAFLPFSSTIYYIFGNMLEIFGGSVEFRSNV